MVEYWQFHLIRSNESKLSNLFKIKSSSLLSLWTGHLRCEGLAWWASLFPHPGLPPPSSTQESACGASRNEAGCGGKREEAMWVLCDLGRRSQRTLPLQSVRLQRHSSTPPHPTYQPALYSMGGASMGPNLVLGTLSCTLERHLPVPSASVKAISQPRCLLSTPLGMSQRALTVSPGLPETQQALQEVLPKCL